MARLLVLIVVALAAGCGPTPAEAAGAVLFVAPVAILAGHLFIRLLVWLWRPVRVFPISARPALMATAAAALGAAFVARASQGDILEWTVAALWLFGTTYVALLLVSWRLWAHFHAETASSWSFVAPLSLTILPALPLLLGVRGDLADTVIVGWMVIGYGGMVAGPILLLLVVEALIRRRLAARRR